MALSSMLMPDSYESEGETSSSFSGSDSDPDFSSQTSEDSSLSSSSSPENEEKEDEHQISTVTRIMHHFDELTRHQPPLFTETSTSSAPFSKFVITFKQKERVVMSIDFEDPDLSRVWNVVITKTVLDEIPGFTAELKACPALIHMTSVGHAFHLFTTVKLVGNDGAVTVVNAMLDTDLAVHHTTLYATKCTATQYLYIRLGRNSRTQFRVLEFIVSGPPVLVNDDTEDALSYQDSSPPSSSSSSSSETDLGSDFDPEAML